MQLLIRGKEIVAYAENISFGTFDEDFEKWRLADGDDALMYYMLDGGFTLIENVELPSDYVDGKYFYENGGFVLNEEWKPYVSPEERIAQLEETVAMHEENDAELLFQISLLQLGIDEDLLGEEV